MTAARQLVLELHATQAAGCIREFRADHPPAEATTLITVPAGGTYPVYDPCAARWRAHAAHPMRPYRIEVTPRPTAAPSGGSSPCTTGA